MEHLPRGVRTAISQLSEIHAQILRTEVFRGYRSKPMACTSALALVAALVQHCWLPARDAGSFALLWIATAGLCVVLCSIDLLRGTLVERGDHEVRRVLRVVSQLVPAFVVGGVLPIVLVRPELAAVELLPGLWAIVFGLAIFASRPFLPRAVGWVGLWYCGAGSVLLLAAAPGIPGPWGMGVTFGIGQALGALVLWFGLERRSAEVT